ncbi:MAG: hypothetical protein LLG09_09530 [Negativicutes bacterium]|nr:hypothetical protein [Negativicutes bacterium]
MKVKLNRFLSKRPASLRRSTQTAQSENQVEEKQANLSGRQKQGFFGNPMKILPYSNCMNFFDRPLGDVSHELLQTHDTKRGIYNQFLKQKESLQLRFAQASKKGSV